MVRALSFGTALVLFVIGCGGASSSGDPNFDAVAEKARTGDKDGALRMVLSYGGGPARWRSFEAQSDSMGPTIEGGDRFLVQSIDYTKTHPRRGEVVAFIPTSAQLAACLSSPSTIYVKRVVGIAGDRVTVTRGSPAVVNGASERSVGRPADYEANFSVVPNGHLLVLGDNRPESCDAHLWQRPGDPTSALVELSQLIGRVEVVYAPPNRAHRVR
jgi:signal peptidase I